jgi:mono/diheme cytochrome c family protein
MRGTRSTAHGMRPWGPCLCLGLALGGMSGLVRAGEGGTTKPDPIAVGYEIFNREWMPNDSRGHGGDGLGPVYNDTSCVACHNAGGGGGGGPSSKNIDVLSASLFPGGVLTNTPTHLQPATSVNPIDALIDFHAGFKTGRTVVLHKFGSDPTYNDWRALAVQRMLTQGLALPTAPLAVTASGPVSSTANTPANGRADEQIQRIREAVRAASASSRQSTVVGAFKVARSQRNPTALFGLGLVDTISEQDINAAAMKQALNAPDVKGRVSRLKDGRIGRLGWKGQTANVEDFVLNACAVELGLEVPGHSQANSPQAPKYRTTGLDLTADECSALVAYVRALPRPIEREASSPAEAKHIAAGKAAFTSVGCASCHTPKLGSVAGLYSDLLLHDMGDDMADDGSYSDGFDDGSDDPFGPDVDPIAANAAKDKPAPSRAARGASQREWRTPPLWGFRDSGPYLHDGRAQTLDEAVALHGGQGEASAKAYFALSPRERLQVEAFLKTLTAPAPVTLAQRGE